MEPLILIPTYFGGKLVQNCTASILDKVANPRYMVYKNTVGWLQACNEMIDATKSDVILLNDDTIIETDIVAALQELAHSDPDIGIVGGLSLLPNLETIGNYGIYVAPDGNTGHKHFGQQKNEVDIEKQRAVEGSCMYIKRDLINEIGTFSPKYGMGYRSEVDYCFRAREVGWTVMSTPKAQYFHYNSATTSKLGIANDTHEIFMEDWGRKLKLGEI